MVRQFSQVLELNQNDEGKNIFLNIFSLHFLQDKIERLNGNINLEFLSLLSPPINIFPLASDDDSIKARIETLEQYYSDYYVDDGNIPYNSKMARSVGDRDVADASKIEKRRRIADSSRISRDRLRFVTTKIADDSEIISAVYQAKLEYIVNLEKELNDALNMNGHPDGSWLNMLYEDDSDDDEGGEDTANGITFSQLLLESIQERKLMMKNDQAGSSNLFAASIIPDLSESPCLSESSDSSDLPDSSESSGSSDASSSSGSYESEENLDSIEETADSNTDESNNLVAHEQNNSFNYSEDLVVDDLDDDPEHLVVDISVDEPEISVVDDLDDDPECLVVDISVDEPEHSVADDSDDDPERLVVGGSDNDLERPVADDPERLVAEKSPISFAIQNYIEPMVYNSIYSTVNNMPSTIPSSDEPTYIGLDQSPLSGTSFLGHSDNSRPLDLSNGSSQNRVCPNFDFLPQSSFFPNPLSLAAPMAYSQAPIFTEQMVIPQAPGFTPALPNFIMALAIPPPSAFTQPGLSTVAQMLQHVNHQQFNGIAAHSHHVNWLLDQNQMHSNAVDNYPTFE